MLRQHLDSLTKRPLRRRAALFMLAVSALLAAALMLYGQPAPAYAQSDCTYTSLPRNVQASPGHDKLTLTWDEPASWGSWGGEGYDRSYQIEWRRPGSNRWNIVVPYSNLQYPITAYQFTGTYREQPNTGPSRDHTVSNGTTYELQIRAVANSPDCGSLQASFAQVSGTPLASEGTLSDDATLSSLELVNATTGSTAPAALGFEFTSNYEDYYAKVLKEVTSVAIKPKAAAGNAATIKLELERNGTSRNAASGSVSQAVTITPKTDLSVPHNLYVTVTAENGSDTKTYNIRVFQFEPLSFGDATVSDVLLTAGVRSDVPKLPAVTDHDRLDVSYAATGLPSGLWLGDRDRVIHGIPEAATNGPATVTYTATSAELGSSASLTFQLTVNPPVTFSEADRLRILSNVLFAYTVGQASPLTFTFPEASGGAGTLTYHLSDSRAPRTPISDLITGISFDPATRVLTIGAGGQEPSGDPAQCYAPPGQQATSQQQRCTYGIKFWAEDENGSTATISSIIYVSEAPILPEIADRSFTVGDAVSIGLPEATRGGRFLDYTLTPDLEGLTFNGPARTITGTAAYTGISELTYTATDSNGISGSRTFTLSVASGPSAPASAPTLTASSESGRKSALLEWSDLADATGYVVQVRSADESFPSQAVVFLPSRNASTQYQTRTTSDGDRVASKSVAVNEGEYTPRVAAVNADGAGPWSAEVTFTVNVGGL